MTNGLGAYLDLLYGAEPAGAFLEVRWSLPDRPGMGQLWRPVEHASTAVDSILAIGAKTDCYVGCAPRTRRYGGRDAIERGHVLWLDCDTPESIAAVEQFSPAPSMMIRSGSGQHVYWSLWPPVEIAEVERANRRLAHALGADTASADAARILRPPGTFNFKASEPRPVEVERINVEVYAPESIVGDLADPPAPERPTARTVGLSTATDDPLLTIAPAVYVELLTGREVGRDGKIACPFHDDRTPSLHAFGDPERGWTCFGCPPDQNGRARGGTIIDFAGLLWDLEPRGAGYHEIRRRLAAVLLGREA